MPSQERVLSAGPVRHGAVGVTCVLAAFLIIPAQLGSMIVFDTTGLDSAVPTLLFMGLLPAAAVAVLPAVLAGRVYDRREALVASVGVLVVYAVLATYLIRFYGVCGGPGC